MTEKIELLEAKLQSSEKEVLGLQSLTGATARVAFSARLRDSCSENIGPFITSVLLKYKRVFSNIGNSYSISTALVKGMYFFRFSVFVNFSPAPNSVVSLVKNNQQLTSVWDSAASNVNNMSSNAVVIPP